jgi:predicted nucleotidyltransferase
MTDVFQHDLEERMRCELPHLTAEDRRVLVCIIERLVEVYQPDRIYLFGSKARGDAGPAWLGRAWVDLDEEVSP